MSLHFIRVLDDSAPPREAFSEICQIGGHFFFRKKLYVVLLNVYSNTDVASAEWKSGMPVVKSV